jgi:hypothetical protein
MVFGEFLMVDAENDREIGVISRSGDKNALGSGSEMGGGFVARCENACAFERDINAEFLVRKLGGIAHGGDLDRAATDIDRVACDSHGTGEAAMDRVKAHEMGIGLDRAEIIDRHDFDVGAAGFDDRTENIAADAAKPINCNAD